MSPLRLIVLAALFYLGYRILRGSSRRDRQARKNEGPRMASGSVSDVLVEDPVCHCLVPKGQAIRLQHQGVLVYFCSENCCNAFLEKGKKE